MKNNISRSMIKRQIGFKLEKNLSKYINNKSCVNKQDLNFHIKYK